MKTGSPFDNPFAGKDPDRRDIWEMLVVRDCEGFLRKNWSMVDGDFIREAFEGIVAHESADPDRWTLAYPTLESYRDDWLKEAEEFLHMQLAAGTHRDLIYGLTHLRYIEINQGRALAHKQFQADAELRGGGHYRLYCQTLYRLHRVEGRWKIVGFVGYLPLHFGGAGG